MNVKKCVGKNIDPTGPAENTLIVEPCYTIINPFLKEFFTFSTLE